MTPIRFALCALVLALSSRATLAADGPIAGFEDPAVLSRVMGGEIVAEEKAATGKEFETVFRAFFKGVSPDAYRDLATNHVKYPDLFPDDVKSAETTKSNKERTEFEYKMDLVFRIGIFVQHVYPELRQVYTPAPDAVSEAKMWQTVLNYKEYLTDSTETTRLIPYQGGILIHDTIHFTLAKENSQTTLIKNKMKEKFLLFLTTFRTVLGGNP